MKKTVGIFLSFILNRTSNALVSAPAESRVSFHIFSLLSFFLLFSAFSVNAHAAIWYVSQSVASSGNGQSWGTAWKNTGNIGWGSLSAGDTVYLDGGTMGSAGLSYTALSTNKNGAPGQRITLKRSEEPGRNGKVTLSAVVRIMNSYITLDGVDRDLFVINANNVEGGNTAQGAVYTSPSGDKFELKNVSVIGSYSASFGNSIGSDGDDLTISGCYFYKTPYQDFINYKAGGTFTIENTLFRSLDSSASNHRDVLNAERGGYNLVVKGNIFFEVDGDMFLMQNSSEMGDIVFAYNVVHGAARALASGTGGAGANSVKSYNNVFYDVTAGVQGFSADSKNNITKLQGASTIRGDDGTILSTGDFLDVTNPLGTNGKPFTSQDGFVLKSGSLAINKGTAIPGYTVDILGRAISGKPDLGAYENGGTVSPPTNTYHPADTNADFLMVLNEATSFAACWKTNCNPDATLNNAVRAGTLWNATANGQYQYNVNLACPQCWEVKP